MSKRLKHPAGPANMHRTTHRPAVDQPFLQKVPGFAGFKGWVYHPTRGFKKVSGFIPPIIPKVSKEPVAE